MTPLVDTSQPRRLEIKFADILPDFVDISNLIAQFIRFYSKINNWCLI